MGKKPDQIEREIRERRERISHKLADLQDKLEVDMEQAMNAVSEEASGMLEQAERRLRLNERMQESPMTVLGGGFGVGVLLGAASEGFRGKKRDSSTQQQMDQSSYNGGGGGGGGALSGAFASITGSAANVVSEEIRQFVRASLYGPGKEPGGQNGGGRQESERQNGRGGPEQQSSQGQQTSESEEVSQDQRASR